MDNINILRKEYQEIIKKLGTAELVSDREKFEELSKRKSHLEPFIEKEIEKEKIEKEIEENKKLISTESDQELVSLAHQEISSLSQKKTSLESQLQELLKRENDPSSLSEDVSSIIIEVRAGTGGNEAALFAGDLFRMYSRYAESKSWKQKILNSHPTELGGFKEIILQLKSRDAWEKMKYEAGVHRVQRIPETEKSERIHTSTATVAVLPQFKKIQTAIRPDDLRIDLYRSSGPGGQYVNKRETAVRITHMPSGIVVASQTERNQLNNKENAMSILQAKVSEREREKRLEKTGSKRKGQIGQAKRSEKIRTYNFPQDRLTDHRIKKSWHNLEKIMAGEIGKIIETLQRQFENQE